MAVAPTAAADPAADMEGEDMAAAPEAPAEAPEAQGTVIASIVANTDGSFPLMQGDEPESMHNGEEAAEDEGDMAPADDEAAEGEGQVPSQTYDSVGELMRAVLELVRAHEESGGKGSEQDQFNAGFGGGEEPASVPGKAPTY